MKDLKYVEEQMVFLTAKQARLVTSELLDTATCLPHNDRSILVRVLPKGYWHTKTCLPGEKEPELNWPQDLWTCTSINNTQKFFVDCLLKLCDCVCITSKLLYGNQCFFLTVVALFILPLKQNLNSFFVLKMDGPIVSRR